MGDMTIRLASFSLPTEKGLNSGSVEIGMDGL
jgi:hypothetical protein